MKRIDFKTSKILLIDKKQNLKLTRILTGEHDFTPINPIDDGYIYHLNTLEKFIDGSLEFDVKPCKKSLNEIEKIINKMKNHKAFFLYLK